MKKTIVTVFSIILVLIIMGFVVNVVTGGSFVNSVVSAVAGPINKAWKAVAGDTANNLIDVESVINDSGVKGDTSMDGLYDDKE